MLFGAFLITFMILWMAKQRKISEHLHRKVDEELSKNSKFGVFLLVFVSVLREGVETVIFLGSAAFVTGEQSYSLAGALLGIAAAIILGYALFANLAKVDLHKIFTVTSILLILFAAGLIAHGIHEYQEAGVLPFLTQQAWDLNPPENADGSFPALHENGLVGGVAKGLFGYNGNPSWLEIFGYAAYLALMVFAFKPFGKR